MTNLLKTEEGRSELRSYLIGIMEEGGTLTSTQFVFLIALNNTEENNGD